MATSNGLWYLCHREPQSRLMQTYCLSPGFSDEILLVQSLQQAMDKNLPISGADDPEISLADRITVQCSMLAYLRTVLQRIDGPLTEGESISLSVLADLSREIAQTAQSLTTPSKAAKKRKALQSGNATKTGIATTSGPA